MGKSFQQAFIASGEICAEEQSGFNIFNLRGEYLLTGIAAGEDVRTSGFNI